MGLVGLLSADTRAVPPDLAAAPIQVAAIVPQAAGATSGDAVSATGTQAPSSLSGSLTLDTSVGLGTFAPAPHRQTLVSTTVLGNVGYRLTDTLRLSAGISATWFNVNDSSTPLPDNFVMLSDLSLGVSHGRIYRHEGSKFNLSGAFRLLLPTSPASQFQNRWFTIVPSLSASMPVGPVSLSWGVAFGKFFGSTSTATVDCSDFDDPEQCYQGRSGNATLGYETERRGGEVFVPGVGMNSFYVSNSLSASWSPTERLNFGLSLGVFSYFGLRSLPVDALSSVNAVGGRAHRDRLVSSLTVSYQLFDNLSLSSGLITDTSQPFGARGDSPPVVFDFTRPADNITSVSLGLTGTF